MRRLELFLDAKAANTPPRSISKASRVIFSVLTLLFLSIGQVWAADVEVSFASWTVSCQTYSSTEWTDNGCTFTYASNNQTNWSYVRCGGKSTSATSTIEYNTKITVPIDSVVLSTPSRIANGSSSSITITGIEVAAYSDAGFSTLVSSKDLGTLAYTSSNCPTSIKIAPTTAWAKDLYYKISISWTATGNKNCGLNVSSIKFWEHPAAPSYDITAASNNNSYGTVALSGSVITATANSGYRIDEDNPYTISPDGSATVVRGTGVNINKFTVTPSANTTVTINFKAIPTHNIIFNNGGVKTIANAVVAEGASYDITETIENSLIASCTYKKFEGWTRSSSIENANVKPTLVTSVEMEDEDVDLYAVYSITSGSGSGAAVDATLFSENFGGFESGDKMEGSQSTETGNRFVYNSGSVTYSYSNGTSADTKIYEQNSAGGSSPELLVGKNNSTFTITGIPTGSANTAILTYHSNQSSNLTVSTTTENVTIGNVSTDATDTKLCSRTITFSEGAASTFNMTFTMTTSSNARLDDIEIIVATTDAGGSTTYSLDAGCAAPGQCVAPTFDPGQGTYDAAQSVELATTTDGADIYYTTNGNDPEPGEEGTFEYTSAIPVAQNTTIKAIAIKGDMTDSEVSTGEFKIRFATAPTFGPTEGNYTSAQSVTMAATGAEHIYYTMTSDGSTPADPTIESLEYTDAIPLSANGTYKFKAIAVKAGFAPSNVTSATFVLDLPYGSIAEFIAGESAKPAANRVVEDIEFTADDNCIITGVRSYKNNQNADRWDIYMQDASNKGIIIYGLTSLPTNADANHKITGTLAGKYSPYNNQEEIANANFTNVTISSDAVSRPTPVEISELNATTYAANPMTLVTLSNVKYDGIEYTFDDNIIYNTFGVLTGKTMPETDVSCDITGIFIKYNSTYELLPVFASDIVADADAAAPTVSPTGGADAASAVTAAAVEITAAANTKVNGLASTTVDINSTDPVEATVEVTRDFYRTVNYSCGWYKAAAAKYAINGQTSTAEEGTIVAKVENVAAETAAEGDDVHVFITPNAHFELATITVNGGAVATTTVIAGTEYKFDMPAEVVTIAVTWNEDAKVNVQFAKGKEAAEGTVPSTMSNKYENDVITLPANPFTLTSWKFKGWKHSLTDAIHQPGSYTITAADVAEDAITFAAEWEAMPDFAGGAWMLVTDVAELTEGSYVMIAAAGYDYAMKPWVSNANHCVRKAATKDGEFLTYDSEFAIFEVKNYVVAEEVVGKSFLNVNSAKYLCYSSGLKEQTAQADASAWTLSFDGSNVFHAYNKNATTYEIRYNNNSGTERFACYAGTQNAIALYKYHTPSLKLTYDKNAGEDAVTGMPSMGIADGDNKVTISDATPLREGYLFDGWKDADDHVYEANHEYTLTANLTIYAQWQTATAHSLSYDKDGGEGDVPAATNYYPNVNVTLANAVTKEGYIFAGWEYDGNIYAAGTSFTMPNEAVVMKAKYATGAVYTITSRTEVTAQGAPAESTATFVNTYENDKSQMTSGNSMTLTLTGYDLYTIKAITLRMHSNASKGYGTLSVTIGGNPVSFTTNKWYDGEHYSSSYEDIKVTLTPTRVQTGENIVIEIAASQNSLYCQSFAIEYERVLDEIRTNLSDGKWGTICPKQEVKYPSGASFYQLTYMEKNPDNSPYKFFFDEIAEGASLEAGKPYLFIAEGEAVKGIKVGAEAADGDHAYNGFVGYLGTSNKALASDDYIFTNGGYNYYGLQNNIFKLIGSGQMLNERAYVEVSPDRAPSTTPVPMPAYSRRRLVVGAGAPQVTTGMDELNASEAPVKVMIDGNLYILRGEKMYDATGRLVK